MSHYAYIHARPDTRDALGVFYVGKGAGRRFRPSIRRNRHHSNVVAKHGAENILVGVIECSSEDIAHALERGLIKCLRRSGAKLVNLTDGGEGSSGYVPTEEAKAKIGEAFRRKWSNPEYRAKVSEAQKLAQKNPANFTEKKRASSLRNAEVARAALQNPEVREQARLINAEKSRAMWSDPAFKDAMKKRHAALWDVDRRKEVSARTRGRVRMTNGVEERNVLPEQVEELLAIGWTKGRRSSPRKEL
ncbi:MAG: hypothetical protein RLZZ387_2627 [Chloroflexota bacterium]|jgi:hypothetical protein